MDNNIAFTPEQKELLGKLEKYAGETIDKETANLRCLIDVISQSVEIRLVNGQVVTSVSLSSTDMEALAMKIPAECLYLQSRMNQFNTKNVFRDMALDAETTAKLASMVGQKGTADERKKQAEMAFLTEKIENAVNKLIIKGIQGCIDRADKTYEGIKKVMDYRAREGWFDRKNNTP